jgi:sugar phosphate isomerase/epimerase
MKYGAMQGILRAGSTIEAAELAVSVGFDGLEIDVTGPTPADNQVWSAAGRKELLEYAGRKGFAYPSICLGFLNKLGSLAAEDERQRQANVDSVRSMIEIAMELGATVLLVPFFGKGEMKDPAHFERTQAGLSALAPEAEAAGVRLAMENTLSAEDNQRILLAVGSPAIQVYFDVSNSTWWKHDAAADIVRLSGDMAQIHFKDGQGKPSNAMLGSGHVDWLGVRSSLVQIGYDGWIVLESAVLNDPLADAATNLSFARKLMASA